MLFPTAIARAVLRTAPRSWIEVNMGDDLTGARDG